YDPSRLHAEQLNVAIKKLGYGTVKESAANHDNGSTAADYRDKEIRGQKRRLLLSAVLSLPLLWSMAGHFAFTEWMYVPALFMNPWFQLALAAPVQFYVGRSFYVGAYKALRNGSANMDVLVAL